jgi:predicted DNA-binding transcriptional regulator AlpA
MSNQFHAGMPQTDRTEQAHQPTGVAELLQAILTELRRQRMPPPEQVPAKFAARLVGVSPAAWYRLVAAGKTPRSNRLGGRVLWSVEELRSWIGAGCPPRPEWEAMQAGSRNGQRR